MTGFMERRMTGLMDRSSRMSWILLADRTLYPMSSEDIQRNAAIHDGQRLGCSVNNDFDLVILWAEEW